MWYVIIGGSDDYLTVEELEARLGVELHCQPIAVIHKTIEVFDMKRYP